MIRETLEVLRPGTQTMAEMAEQLGVSAEDLRQRLRILEDRGYIQKAEGPGSCGGSSCKEGRCVGCACSSSTAPNSVTYALTGKGRKAMDKG